MFATLPTREWGCARRYNPTPLSSAHSVLIQEPRDSLSQALNLSNHHVPVNFPHAVVSLSNDSEEVSKIVTVNLNRTILEVLSQRDPRSPHHEGVVSHMHSRHLFLTHLPPSGEHSAPSHECCTGDTRP